MSSRTIAWLFTITIILFLLTNLFMFDNISKKTFFERVSSEMTITSKLLDSEIQKFSKSIEISDSLLAHSLRNTAIAISNNIPESYEDVSNDQLSDLAEHLDINMISLIAPRGNDFIVVRSSEPSRVGMRPPSSDTYNSAFRQLLNLEHLEGSKLKNYWSDQPIAGALNSHALYKNGFYYDGRTNYIINPYVDNGYSYLIEQGMDLNAYIETMLREEEGVLLDIAVFWDIPAGSSRNNQEKSGEWSPPKIELLFGTNVFEDPRDLKYIQKAVEGKENTSYRSEIRNHKIVKTFYHCQDTNGYTYIISITGNLDHTNHVLKDYILKYATLSLILTIIGVFIRECFKRNAKFQKEPVVASLEHHESTADPLWIEVRGQRHDFHNHLDTLHGLLELEYFDDAKAYINEIVEETATINEIIDIGVPEISALILSKYSKAMAENITFKFELTNLTGSKPNLTGSRKVDVVKILGNLLDNAFDEVLKMNPDRRLVVLNGEIRNCEFRFSVRNKVKQQMSVDLIEQMFLPRESTKNSTGIGLNIVRERVKRNKGSLHYELPEDGYIQFNVWLPIGE